MTDYEWTPWIDHDGKGCPCLGMLVNTIHENGYKWEGIAGSKGGLSWDWSNYPLYSRIVRYRIRKPRGVGVLHSLIECLPGDVTA